MDPALICGAVGSLGAILFIVVQEILERRRSRTIEDRRP